jgi:glutathione-specific gamma-glutamylcyclotransferase
MSEFDQWLFGYGSLVNDRAWIAPSALRPVSLAGWVRQWRHCTLSSFGPVCTLTLQPKPGATVDGVAFALDHGHWFALDEREVGYHRVEIDDHTLAPRNRLHLYSTAGEALRWADSAFPILQSYVDCVLDGYYRRFGEAGLTSFMNSTEGWFGSIYPDRDDPIYPRAQKLDPTFLARVDFEIGQARAAGR